jgi:hypothetical protein
MSLYGQSDASEAGRSLTARQGRAQRGEAKRLLSSARHLGLLVRHRPALPLLHETHRPPPHLR